MVGALARLILAAGLLGLPLPAMASVRSGHMTAEIAAEALAGGTNVDLAITLTPDAGWHTYWINPGDTGLPPDVSLTLPQGSKAAALQWPAPQRLTYDGVVTFGYDHAVTALSEAHLSQAAVGHSVRAHVEALVCRDTCEPVSFDLATRIAAPSSLDPFAKARAALPHQISLASAYTYTDDKLQVGFQSPVDPDIAALFQHPQGVDVFSESGQILAPSATQTLSTGPRGFSVSAEALNTAHATDEQGLVLVFPNGRALRTTVRAGVIPAGVVDSGSQTKAPAVQRDFGVALAVFLALAGGVVLNLMPCVFPVLSMKLLALTRSGHDRKVARREALVYGAGVLLSFIALAAMIEVARALGAAVGWGFQLQSPLVTAALALLMLMVGLNLSGVFEIGASLQSAAGAQPLGQRPYLAAFFTGVLAVVVAAPCSAPFMATATGVAIARGGWASIAIFAALGTGFAAPFVLLTWLLTLVPALGRFLPRPGPWMDGLRRALAVPMYLAAVWMAWVFWQQVGPMGLCLLLAGLATMGLALTLRPVSGLLKSGAVAGGVALCVVGALQTLPAEGSNQTTDKGHIAFSPQSLATLRAQGQPVLVDFTAAWCITCKVNERVALSDKAVRSALGETHTRLMVGDWTRRDAEITAFLTGFGRSGVPLYIYYGPGNADPVILPQILTPGDVLKVVRATKSVH